MTFIYHGSEYIEQKEQVVVILSSALCRPLRIHAECVPSLSSGQHDICLYSLFPLLSHTTVLQLSSYLTSSSFVCPPPPHLYMCLLSPLRSKWRTLLRTPPPVLLPPPPLSPLPPSPSLLRCCALHLPLLPPASSASLLLCRRARSRTERPTTTLHLRSSGLQ